MNAPLLPGQIEHWRLALLKSYARNARTHDANQVAGIAASMAKFGWTMPARVAAAVLCLMLKPPENKRKIEDASAGRQA